MSRLALSLLVLAPLWISPPPAGARDLRFARDRGAASHRFARVGGVQAHLAVDPAPRPRVVLATPAGDLGAGLWLAAPGGAPLDLEVRRGPEVVPGDPTTLRARVAVDAPVVEVESFLLGSLRTLRDHARGDDRRRVQLFVVRHLLRRHAALAPLAQRVERWLAAPSRERGSLVLDRPTLDGRHHLRAAVVPRQGTRLRMKDGKASLAAIRRVEFDLVLTHDLPPMPPLDAEPLLGPAAQRTLRELGRSAPGEARRLRELLAGLDFLITRDAFLAGSWRFLTYFGRDTLLTLRLLAPVLSDAALQGGLETVLRRLAPDGAVTHEEELVDQVAYARLDELVTVSRSQPTRKAEILRRLLEDLGTLGLGRTIDGMGDDDLLLPGAARDLLGRLSPARREAVLAAPIGEETFRDRVARNAGKVRALLGQELVALEDGHAAGDWRDSNEGLGGGRYSFETNGALLTTAPGQLEELRRLGALPADTAIPARPGEPRHRRFRVELPADEVRDRLRRFLADLPLDTRRTYRARPLPEGAPTLGAFVDGGPSPFGARYAFHAVSLDADRRPIPVMTSDTVFLLLDLPDAGLEARELDDILRTFELPYPLGLATPVGFVVANAAFLEDRELRATFGRDRYHGAVVWSWQLAMLEAAFLRHHDGPSSSRWARLVRRLRAFRRAHPALAQEELWSFTPTRGELLPRAFGEAAGDATESNPLQLWSHGWLANDLVMHQRAGGP